MQKVGIIGGGICGRGIASKLRGAGISVDIFDKGGGGCGRCATKYAKVEEDNLCSFDSGAQYFTVDDDIQLGYFPWIERGLKEGTIASWFPRIATSRNGILELQSIKQKAFVPVPSMSKIGDIVDPTENKPKFHSLVNRIFKKPNFDDGWFVELEHEQTRGPYTSLVITTPPIQAAEILKETELGSRLSRLTRELGEFNDLSPCRVMMLEFDTQLDLNWDGIVVKDGYLGENAWIGCNSNKPGRSVNGRTSFVIQASEQTSIDTFDVDASSIKIHMLEAFYSATGINSSIKPVFVNLFRWKYGQTKVDLSNGKGYLKDEKFPEIIYTGGSCNDGKILNVVLSGYNVADILINLN